MDQVEGSPMVAQPGEKSHSSYPSSLSCHHCLEIVPVYGISDVGSPIPHLEGEAWSPNQVRGMQSSFLNPVFMSYKSSCGVPLPSALFLLGVKDLGRVCTRSMQTDFPNYLQGRPAVRLPWAILGAFSGKFEFSF